VLRSGGDRGREEERRRGKPVMANRIH